MPSPFYWLSHLSFNLGEKFKEKNKTISHFQSVRLDPHTMALKLMTSCVTELTLSPCPAHSRLLFLHFVLPSTSSQDTSKKFSDTSSPA